MKFKGTKAFALLMSGMAVLLITFLAVLSLRTHHATEHSIETASNSASNHSLRPAIKDITPTLVVDSEVIAAPVFAMWTGSSGPLTISVKSGDQVKAGTQLALIGKTPVLSPADGRVEWTTNAALTDVPKNFPFIKISYSGFAVPVQVAASEGYRVSSSPTDALISLTKGASGVRCVLVKAAAGSGDKDSAAGSGSVLTPEQSGSSTESQWPPTLCLISKKVEAYPGQHAKIGIHFETVTNALTLPLTAVTGTAQTGTVQLCSDTGDRRETRQVELGTTDGTDIVITSGISSSDSVCSIPPTFGAK